ncbi:hypothetical protein ACFL2Q_14335 [Thermodesulfobacteriota bacterium]
MEKGGDCGGILRSVYFKAVVPVIRSTSYRMYKGLDGWKSRPVMPPAEMGDLCLWTFKKSRPKGHVGSFIDADWFSDAGSKGFVKRCVDSWMGKRIEDVKRLTFGD